MNPISNNQTTEVSIIYKPDFIATFVHGSSTGKMILQKIVDLFSMCVKLFGNLFPNPQI